MYLKNDSFIHYSIQNHLYYKLGNNEIEQHLINLLNVVSSAS